MKKRRKNQKGIIGFGAKHERAKMNKEKEDEESSDSDAPSINEKEHVSSKKKKPNHQEISFSRSAAEKSAHEPENGHEIRLLPGSRPRDDTFDFDAYQQGYDGADMVDVDHLSDSDAKESPNTRVKDKRNRSKKPFGNARDHYGTEKVSNFEENGGTLAKQRKSGKGKKADKNIEGVGSRGFGMKPADYADGGAFSEMVGTKFVEENRFFLPEDSVRSIIRDGDPLARIQAIEEQRAKARAEMLADRARRKQENTERKRKEQMVPGVLYVGRIPFGFFEEAQYQYFSQFGTVTRIRLARSRRTSGYKGYGYVEFEDVNDARAAARVCRRDGRDTGGGTLIWRVVYMNRSSGSCQEMQDLHLHDDRVLLPR